MTATEFTIRCHITEQYYMSGDNQRVVCSLYEGQELIASETNPSLSDKGDLKSIIDQISEIRCVRSRAITKQLTESAKLSAELSPRRTRRAQRVWLSPKLWNLYNGLCRILGDRPGCKLRLTKFGVDITVDKRGFSQEKRAELFLSLGDFRVQAAKECILTSIVLVDPDLDRL